MKRIIIILLILFSVAIAGCQFNPGVKEPQKVEYHLGTEGVVIETLREMPADIVFEKDEFIVGVELKNQGAYDVSNGVVAIIGLDPKYIKMDKEQDFFNVPGKSPSYPEGGYDVKHFRLKNIWFPTGKESQLIPFTIIADYDYQTQAKVEVCINPDVYSYVNTKEKACEVKSVSVSEGQGAPVAITQVDPSIALFSQDYKQMDARFGIHIQNVADGRVIGDINIDEALLGTKLLSCTPVRKESLDEDEANSWYTSCSAALYRPGESYTSPLILTLSYRYRNRLNKEVTIKSTLK